MGVLFLPKHIKKTVELEKTFRLIDNRKNLKLKFVNYYT